jgi:YVTN family beta-propeller protein
MHKRLLTVVTALGLAAGCGASDSAEKSSGGSYDGAGASSSNSRSSTPGVAYSASDASVSLGAGGKVPVVDMPAEVEQALTFDAPLAGARFVYVANASLDSVSVIDSRTLGVRTVAVGSTPGNLTTVPGNDTALVINKGSKTASIVRAAAAAVKVTSVPVVAAVNRISVAPDGLHAVAWYDVNRASQGALPGSMQNVSVITLNPAGDSSVSMSVGNKPNAVVFSNDSQAAFVVGSDGISVLRFAEIKTPGIARLLSVPFVAPTPTEETGVEASDGGADGGTSPVDASTAILPVFLGDPSAVPEVSVTDDGRYAVARREGSSVLVLIDLMTAEVKTLNLGVAITDLDMTKVNGETFAFVVLRNTSSLVRVPVPAGFAGGSTVTWQLKDAIIGSAVISNGGARAVLYTTAVDSKRLVVLDLVGTAVPRAVQLSKNIRALAITPDGKSALVEHKKATGNPDDTTADLNTRLDRAYGYTMVDLGTGRTVLQITPADIGTFTVTPDSKYAFVLLRDKTLRSVQRLELGSFLVDDIKVGSPPVSIAALADTKKVFVSQEYSEGRISFIDWETEIVETVTGYEMNGRIQQ